MFEKLLELLAAGWERVSPFVVIHPYEQGVILRLGRFHTCKEAGFHWKWPFVDEVIQVTTCLTTMRLPPQTLTTSDDVQVVVAAIVKYQIRDPEPFITGIYDQNDVLADVTMGAIRNSVVSMTYEDLVKAPPEQAILKEVRKNVNQYGFKIEAVTFTDIGRVRSIRLIQPSPINIAN
jgi:regulator of protease activity HflC (stomatin/prohibitin superfamily)